MQLQPNPCYLFSFERGMTGHSTGHPVSLEIYSLAVECHQTNLEASSRRLQTTEAMSNHCIKPDTGPHGMSSVGCYPHASCLRALIKGSQISEEMSQDVQSLLLWLILHIPQILVILHICNICLRFRWKGLPKQEINILPP